jgi:hypothetical protein
MVIPQAHDEAVLLAVDLGKRVSINRVAKNFVAGLSSGDTVYRSGLPALAIMQTFPAHTFTHAKDFGPDYQCSTCISGSNNPSFQTIEYIKEGARNTGGLISYGDVYMYCVLLLLQEELPPLEPCEHDYEILLQIVRIIENSAPDTTPKILQKLLKDVKGFRSNEEQRRTLIETLGYCGILQTEEHHGCLYKFTRLGLAPRKRHRSDWNYPVDWWMGRDGINQHALRFWFPELDGLIA